MSWFQTEVILKKHVRGFHWISEYFQNISEIGKYKIGQMHIFIQSCEASLTLCESWDKSVTIDMEAIFNRIVPESQPQASQEEKVMLKHKQKQLKTDTNVNTNNVSNNENVKIIESSNSTISALGKNILIGADITVPILNGKLQMGTWQGIWLCEHSNNPQPRKVIVTINGMK